MILTCPRCASGKLDTEKAERTACWFCSKTVLVVVCKGDKCGLKICKPCLQKVLDSRQSAKAAPKPPPKLRDVVPDEGMEW